MKTLSWWRCKFLDTDIQMEKGNEDDFYYDFEIDLNSPLCNVFWRDGQMEKDYELVDDLLVHDITYRTNKYAMICGPFIGMDHHCII